MVSFLSNTLNKKRKLLTVTVILIVTVFIVLSGKSYAYLEKSVEGSCVSLEVGSLVHKLKSEVTVGVGESEKIKVVVSNVDNVASKYQLVYSSDDDLTDVVVGYSLDSTDLPYGDLAKEEEKYVTVIVQNNSASEKTVYIDVRGGLSNNPIEDIILETGENRIKQEIEESKIPMSEILNLESKVDTGTTISFAAISSATNGRGIYRYTEDGSEIYYWRGNIDEVATEKNGIGNHVLFGDYCWEFVRTTKTGGVKMIYDGIPVMVDGAKTCSNTGTASQLDTLSVFNSQKTDNAYIGYMYGLTGITTNVNRCVKLNSGSNSAEIGSETTEKICVDSIGKWATTAYGATHANVVDSEIKKVIDNWFSTSSLNTTKNLKKIEDAVYCNDRSIDTISGYGTGLGYGTNGTAYNTRYRLYISTNITPILECTNLNDRFTVSIKNGNGALTYPIGLITGDELSLAGGVYNSASNNDYFLYSGQEYFSLSPWLFLDGGSTNLRARLLIVGANGAFNNYDANIDGDRLLGVRPVISLAAGTTFVFGGTGTVSNPYIVE